MPWSKKPYIKVEDLEGEVWVDIEDFEGYYQVSNMGRVKSLDREFTSRANINYCFKSKLMKIQFTDRGYAMVRLTKECKWKFLRVNILVAKAFIPNPENKKEANHKNGVRSDNRVANLEWATHQENITHSIEVLGKKSPLGEKHKLSVPIIVVHPNGEKEEVIGLNNAARKFGLAPSAICLVLKNKQKQHKGYTFFHQKKTA